MELIGKLLNSLMTTISNCIGGIELIRDILKFKDIYEEDK